MLDLSKRLHDCGFVQPVPTVLDWARQKQVFDADRRDALSNSLQFGPILLDSLLEQLAAYLAAVVIAAIGYRLLIHCWFKKGHWLAQASLLAYHYSTRSMQSLRLAGYSQPEFEQAAHLLWLHRLGFAALEEAFGVACGAFTRCSATPSRFAKNCSYPDPARRGLSTQLRLSQSASKASAIGTDVSEFKVLFLVAQQYWWQFADLLV